MINFMSGAKDAGRHARHCLHTCMLNGAMHLLYQAGTFIVAHTSAVSAKPTDVHTQVARCPTAVKLVITGMTDRAVVVDESNCGKFVVGPALHIEQPHSPQTERRCLADALLPASSNKMSALAPSFAGIASTSCNQLHRPRCVRVRAAEGFCRDKVNVERKNFQSQGKVYKLKFKGVGEQAIEVACPDDMYILEAAEQAGLDLPSTCKAGICGTCVGRIAQGNIDPSDIADIEFTISKEEQEQGLAMLCMTRPCSDLVIETQCDWGYSLGVKEWDGATGRFSGTPDPLMGTKWNENSN